MAVDGSQIEMPSTGEVKADEFANLSVSWNWNCLAATRGNWRTTGMQTTTGCSLNFGKLAGGMAIILTGRRRVNQIDHHSWHARQKNRLEMGFPSAQHEEPALNGVYEELQIFAFGKDFIQAARAGPSYADAVQERTAA